MISSIECFQLKTTQSINRLARSETNGEPNGNGMMQKGKGMKSAEGKKTKFHSGRNPALRSPIDWHRGDRWLADGCFRSTRRAKANAGFWLVGSVIGIDLPCWRWPAKKTRGFVSGFPVSIRRARAKAAFWLVGFFFRTGRCGANDEPFEKRRDRCKRVLLGILLGLLALLAAWVALGSRPPCLPLRRPPLLGSRPTTDDSRSIFFLVSPFPFVAYCFSWKRFTRWRTKPNYRLKDGFFFIIADSVLFSLGFFFDGQGGGGAARSSDSLKWIDFEWIPLRCRFGVICAFVSNRNVQDGIDELPAALRNAAYDTSVYFNGTRRVNPPRKTH